MGSPVVAGYVLVRPAASPPGMDSVPLELITISDCIMDELPRPECWDWFQDIDEAVRACGSTDDCRVIGVAFEPTDAESFTEAMDGPGRPFFELLASAQPATGALLGYELVGAEYTLDFHSWHCHRYADDLNRSTGISVNELGLLRSHADASAALAWMLTLPDAEAPAPVPWTVVALFAIS